MYVDADCVNDWGALRKWSPDYLREKVGSKCVPIELTPNGKADAVTAIGRSQTDGSTWPVVMLMDITLEQKF